MKKVISTIFSFAIMLGLILIVMSQAVLAADFKYAIKPQFESAESFSDGLAMVGMRDGSSSWYIDKTGKKVLQTKEGYSGNFSEGLAPLLLGNRYGFINKTGKVAIKPQFDEVRAFKGGISIFRIGGSWGLGGKWGVVNRTGKIIIKAQFDDMYDFKDGLAAVKVGSKWGFIDTTGKVVIAPKYDDVGAFDSGLARAIIGVFPKFTKYSYIDKTGKTIIKPHYNWMWDFSEGLAVVIGDSGKYGFIDTTGKLAIKDEFDYIHLHKFSEGLGAVANGGKFGFIDKTGKIVIEPKYSFVEGFKGGLAKVSVGGGSWGVGGLKGFIDKTGKIVIEPKYIELNEFSDGLAAVKVNGKWGYIEKPVAKIPTPKIAIVSLEHVPFVEGDNNKFYISAKGYIGKVQYQLFYIQESVMKEWKLINNVDMSDGWTKPIDAQTPIDIDISSLNLKADKYRFAIRVRRVGVKGLKENKYGDYDDSYPFNLNVVKNENIKLSGDMNIEKTNFLRSENLVIKGVGDLSKDLQYKLHLFDVKNSKWLTDLTEYSTNIDYSLKGIPAGIYIVDLWAKNTNSTKKYDGWKLKVITIEEK